MEENLIIPALNS